MITVNSLSYLNIATISSSKPALSNETIEKLKEFDINISNVSSESEAKRIIEEKTQAEEADNNTQPDARLEKVYQRLKTLSVQMNIPFSSTEKVDTVINKIEAKISMFEEKNDANLFVFSSELQAIQHAYEIVTRSSSKLLTGLDILGETNKAVMGLTDIKK
ncbi:hypothetical protein II906_03790 [bacterium]|nr:hypothetical protein [bacterium]